MGLGVVVGLAFALLIAPWLHEKLGDAGENMVPGGIQTWLEEFIDLEGKIELAVESWKKPSGTVRSSPQSG